MINKSKLVVCSGVLNLLLAAGCASAPQAEDAQAPVEQAQAGEAADTSADAPTKGFDARLSTYEYPYEVSFYTFETQGQTLEMAYMDVKPETPNGQIVVLLHGKNFAGAYWKNTIEALVAQGYRVVVPDQIGFGKSTKPELLQYSVQGLADYTHQLLASIGVEKASFVVHSMGGMIGARYALMFPDAVDKLVMVNPIGLEDWKLKAPYLSVDEWYARERKKTADDIRSYMTDSYFDGQWKPEYETLIDVPVGWIDGPDYDLIAWNSALTYEMIFSQPVVYEFGNISAPTLLIIGDRDRTALGKGDVSPEVRATMGLYGELGKKTAAAIPGAQLVEFEGIGHIPQFEAWDRYIAALSAFLKAE
ncbi:alpha/beta fold hydrolase [Bradymonas sediminis]|uniref:Alpha/beta hydrolase n=1 Tax=Bradymonas sediminis TaxID=1548548 RepID=A0A2Z4FG87_9DELT|nr:alpha/beta hydrolase [Bradymonas sediminis]AWV87952.1 alpha/beta hydrolase [Bradymonas sediminis]TDP62972.1 pimeloyl-ACP methyl ester carboxylesterase [Bradymonas sediminis]